MTISGYVSQLPLEVILAPTDAQEYISQVATEVLLLPQDDPVEEYFSQAVVEVIVLSFYTHNPALGDDAVYYVDDQSTDKNPNKVHPGGHKGGGQGSIITLLAFENIKIPQGVIIRDAWVTFTASDDDSSGTVNANIQALDEDNPEIPDTYNDLILAPKTTSYAVWDDIVAWVAENEYNSVSVKEVVQELINRVGWEFGNTIIVLFEDSSSTPGAYRRAYSRLTSGKEPKLTILWDYPEASALNTPVLDPINNPFGKDFYTVTWNTVAGATSYELWEQYNEEAWANVYTGALLTKDFSDKELGIWSYRVIAYDGSEYSDYSNVESTSIARALSSKFTIGVNL